MKIDGKKLAQGIEERIKAELLSAPQKRVCFVIFEHSFAVEQFVEMKKKVAARIGVHAQTIIYEGEKNTASACEFVTELTTQNFDGIVLQLPIPHWCDTPTIVNMVPYDLDIDVLSYDSLLAFDEGTTKRIPPVAAAVQHILDSVFYNIEGEHIVIVGNGTLVGAPVSRYFASKSLYYKIITEKTPQDEYVESLKNADIIISGVGKTHIIKEDMITRGVFLIDGGTSEQEGKLTGDIDPGCYNIAGYYTPVPGGVGPLAVISVFENLLR